MTDKGKDIKLLEGLLDRFQFTEPIPEEVQRNILSKKRPILIRVLKTVGAFSFFSGVVITIYLWLKKIGISISITKAVISIAAVVSVTYGGYYATTAVMKEITKSTGIQKEEPVEEETATADEETDKESDDSSRAHTIILHNGRVIIGKIMSRGAYFSIMTDSGMVTIPRNEIRQIKEYTIIQQKRQKQEIKDADRDRRIPDSDGTITDEREDEMKEEGKQKKKEEDGDYPISNIPNL